MAPAGSSAKIDAFISEKYIPLERNRKLLLAVLVFLLPVVLFFFLYYSPSRGKIKGLEAQKITATTAVQQAQAAAGNLPQYQAEVKEANQRFEQTAIVLPVKKEIPDLLRNISDLGKGAGLDFLSFTPASEIPKDFYAELPVNISIRGPYHNMGYFLNQVSRLDRIVTVDNIKMDSPQRDGGETLLNSSCRLLTYRFTNTQVNESGKKKKDNQ